jgi:hypothetical protein
MPAPNNRVTLSLEAERRRIIPISQAAELKGVSEATFRRHYRRLIIKLSPRRTGVVLGDVLDNDK